MLASVKLGNKLILFDTHHKHYPYDLLPEQDIVDVGLLIDESDGMLFNLPEPRVTNMRYCKANLKLADEGSIHAEAFIRLEGYNAVSARQQIEKDGQEKFVESLLESGFPMAELDSFQIDNLDNPELPVAVSVNFNAPEFAQIIGEMVYLNTPSINKRSENPFKRETRYFPVEFTYNEAETDEIHLELPVGLTIAELPKGLVDKKTNHQISFINQWETNGNLISYQRSFLRRQLVYGPGDYTLIRDFFDRMVGADQGQLVLQKTSELGQGE